MHLRPFFAASVLSLSVLTAGCTVILSPDESNDDVERCKSASDCAGFADGRLVPQCVTGDSSVNNAPGVCVASWRPQPCDPSDTGTSLGMNYEQAVALGLSAYTAVCEEANYGQRGCPAAVDGCADGLQESDTGICQDPARPVLPGVGGETDLLGQDVLDQYCRFFFCSDNFVCDRSGSQSVCRPCNPDAPLAGGGCEEIWINGSASPIYMDQATLNTSCKGASPIDDDMAAFAGGLPTPPMP